MEFLSSGELILKVFRLTVLVAYVLVHGLGGGQVLALWADPPQKSGCCVGQCCCLTGATAQGCALSSVQISEPPCAGSPLAPLPQDQSGLIHLKPTEAAFVLFPCLSRADQPLVGAPSRLILPVEKIPI